MVTPKAAKRSACDRCRAKRVRCPRAEDSMEPCARCVRLATTCVTSSAGYPGRPRKTARLDGTPGPATTGADISSPASWATPGDSDDLGPQSPALDESMLGSTPLGAGDASLGFLDDLAVAGLSTNPAAYPPKACGFLQTYSDPRSAHGGGDFSGFPLAGESSVPDGIPVLQQQSTTSQHHDLLCGAGVADVTYSDSYDMPSVDFLASPGCLSTPSPAQPLSAASSLVRFGEKMERRVASTGGFIADPRNILEGCPEDSIGMGTENPVGALLMCTKEFIDIIQSLMAPATPSAPSSSPRHLSPAASPAAQSASLSTETTLSVLSSYLALMRLYDSLFHDVYRSLSQISSERIKSIKVKAVFRIGGMSSLQDLPGKAYAKGIVEVIQSHIQTLERCMGLPSAYCLSGEEVAVSSEGVFADSDRARLLHTVMAQEDIKSWRGNRSYVDSIRDNIKNSVALFDD